MKWHRHMFTSSWPLAVSFRLPWRTHVFWWRRAIGVQIGAWFIGAVQGRWHHYEVVTFDHEESQSTPEGSAR